MARTVTLLSLRNQCRQVANMEGSQFISDSELTQYINNSAAELYDLIVESWQDYYLKSTTFPVLNGTDTYALPTDFYKLRGVDLLLDAAGNAITLRPFQFAERNAYAFTPGYNMFGVAQYRYQLQGNNIRFVPVPQTNSNVKLWYIPAQAPMVADIDTLDGIDGWEEYIIVDVAAKMIDKEEGDITSLIMRKNALIQRINDSAPNRDAGEPARISDINKMMPLEYYYFER
jgi:hypothetical protein